MGRIVKTGTRHSIFAAMRAKRHMVERLLVRAELADLEYEHRYHQGDSCNPSLLPEVDAADQCVRAVKLDSEPPTSAVRSCVQGAGP